MKEEDIFRSDMFRKEWEEIIGKPEEVFSYSIGINNGKPYIHLNGKKVTYTKEDMKEAFEAGQENGDSMAMVMPIDFDEWFNKTYGC